MAISTLRTVFSLAWVGGPPLAAILLQRPAGSGSVPGGGRRCMPSPPLVAVFWLDDVTATAAEDAGADEGGHGRAAARRTTGCCR